MSANSRARGCAAALVTAAGLTPGSAAARSPLGYLVSFGSKNDPVVTLLWALIAVSLLVVAIVTVLLLIGLFRRRDAPAPANLRDAPLTRSSRGLKWLYIGSAVSTVTLFGSAVWTFAVLGAITAPPVKPGVEIRVTAHQWWWEVRYQSDDASRTFTTANEIHIPTGVPVRVELLSTDVIHSFWVPQLAGKMDTVPGQQNATWIEAEQPGTYQGQCTEYCGAQHAKMGFLVVAEPRATFDAWWTRQLEGAPAPSSAVLADGQAQFMVHCAICHSIRGTEAGGRLGPDLSHLMLRQTIAAVALPNTPGNLSGWIADPQHVKPGNLMPRLDLPGPAFAHIRQYLETLQ